MSTPKHDDKMHPNRYERAPDERSIYKRYEDANKEIERLTAEVSKYQAVLQAVLNEVAEVAGIDALEKVTKAAQDAVSGSPKPFYCGACRATGLIHCAHPNECGAMDTVSGSPKRACFWPTGCADSERCSIAGQCIAR